MPAIPSEFANAHLGVPFFAHRWHARQSTTTTTSSSSSPIDLTGIIIVFAVVFVFVLCTSVVRCLNRSRAQRSSRVVPPGSRHGPVIAEILAVIRAATSARAQGNRDMHAAVPGPAPIVAQYPPAAMVRPFRPTQANRLPLVNGHDRRLGTSFDAGVAHADAPPPPYTGKPPV